MNSEILFRSIVKGSNFVTPDVLDYIYSDNKRYLAELSVSKIFGNAIYGVTVVDVVKRKPAEHLNKPFIHEDKNAAYDNAIEYIRGLSKSFDI